MKNNLEQGLHKYELPHFAVYATNNNKVAFSILGMRMEVFNIFSVFLCEHPHLIHELDISIKIAKEIIEEEKEEQNIK